MRIALLLISACLAAQAQFKASSTCKFLTPEDAAAVIGAGAKLVTAIENGGCTYKVGNKTLTVAQPATLSDRRALEMGYEASAKEDGKPLPGIGDRAHIKKGNTGYQILCLKGNTMGGVEAYGDGMLTEAAAKQLAEAAKKVAAKL